MPQILSHGADFFPRGTADIHTLRFTKPGYVPRQEGDTFYERCIGHLIIFSERRQLFVKVQRPGSW